MVFPWDRTAHIGRAVGSNRRRDVCVPAKYPQLGAAFCFGAKFHLISSSFCPSGENENTLQGLKQQQRCACSQMILSFTLHTNRCLIIKRVTPCTRGQLPDKPAWTSPPANLLRFLLHLVLDITAREARVLASCIKVVHSFHKSSPKMCPILLIDTTSVRCGMSC